jgi:glycosyl hydrolase family 2
MSSEIEIVVGDVSDVEARVYARYRGSAEGITLRGTLRGPYCEGNRTLPAEFAFRGPFKSGVAHAEAVVPDPCLWSAEMPHLYQTDVEALQGDQVIAEYHGAIGLRRLSPRRPVDFAPGTG